MNQTVLLSVKNLQCVRSERCLFSNLNFELAAGQVKLLEGRNGSGKTSLLRILCGLSLAEEGEVLWQGQNIRHEREDYLKEVLYIGHLASIKGEFSALENLSLITRLAEVPRTEAEIFSALEKFGLRGFEEIPTHYLSAGQKRRVALAKLLLLNAKLWILDEPLTALDVHGVEFIEGLVAEHAKAGGAVIMTTHQAVDIPGLTPESIRLS